MTYLLGPRFWVLPYQLRSTSDRNGLKKKILQNKKMLVPSRKVTSSRYFYIYSDDQTDATSNGSVQLS
jgi:hypothetical protein